jgi:transposase
MMIGGLDVHREQITFDWVDRDSGEVARGRITPATRERFRDWLEELPSHEGAFALEGCTGWRFVVEALQEAGFEVHLSEPADTAALRGRKRRAKTDKSDARNQRELLEQGRLPESWIPPAHIADLRQTVRVRRVLVEVRTQWQQRLQAVLFHLGLAKPEGGLLTRSSRAYLERVDAPSACRHVISVGLRQIDQVQQELALIDRWLRAYARRQPGCRALIAKHYGVSWITGPTILAELGDARRFRNRHAIVRHTGLDITVYASDSKRSRRSALPAGARNAALGAVRGRQVPRQGRRAALWALPAGEGTPGREARGVERGAATRSRDPPHPHRARR